jgi:hypothetical protein
MQNVLLDDLFGGIARITDSVKSCGKDNLVLQQLLEGLSQDAHAAHISHLQGKVAAVEAACNPIREVRHKRLAHRDLQFAIAPLSNPLPGISREVIGRALAAISDFMNSFQRRASAAITEKSSNSFSTRFFSYRLLKKCVDRNATIGRER